MVIIHPMKSDEDSIKRDEERQGVKSGGEGIGKRRVEVACIGARQPVFPRIVLGSPWREVGDEKSRGLSLRCGSKGVRWSLLVSSSTIHLRTRARRGVAQSGVARRGVAWSGVAWCGVARRSEAWRGVAWRGVTARPLREGGNLETYLCRPKTWRVQVYAVGGGRRTSGRVVVRRGVLRLLLLLSLLL